MSCAFVPPFRHRWDLQGSISSFSIACAAFYVHVAVKVSYLHRWTEVGGCGDEDRWQCSIPPPPSEIHTSLRQTNLRPSPIPCRFPLCVHVAQNLMMVVVVVEGPVIFCHSVNDIQTKRILLSIDLCWWCQNDTTSRRTFQILGTRPGGRRRLKRAEDLVLCPQRIES